MPRRPIPPATAVPPRRAAAASAVLALVLVACGSEPAPPSEPAPGPDAAAPVALPDTGRVYERAVVFLATGSDSVFVVPWVMEVRTGGPSVLRRARGWFLRGTAWDPFYDESWETPPIRSPWRPLPHGALRLMMGEGGAMEQISFVEAGRRLDLTLDSSRAEWTGRRGETFRFLDGGLVLAERRVPGLVLDLNRSREVQEGAGGDWMVLASGDSLQAVLHAPLRNDDDRPGAWRGWVRVDFRDVPLATVTVEWSAVRAFDPARREVPVGWTIRSGEGTVEAGLEARSSRIVAGEGSGPILPVDGLFDVVGTLTFEGVEYPVHGLLRHTQGD